MDFHFWQNLRQKIAWRIPSFSIIFLLWYFTVSYIMWDLLESVCKLQDINYACKEYRCIPFFSSRNTRNSAQPSLKELDIFMWKKLHDTNRTCFCNARYELFFHMKMPSSFNDGRAEFLVFLELKMVCNDMPYKCNTCLEAYKHFLRSLTWYRKP